METLQEKAIPLMAFHPLSAANSPRGWGKICLVTRLEKQVESDFVTAWSHLITRGLRHDKGDGFMIVKDRIAHVAANEAVRGFLKTNCDTIAYLDSDADVGFDYLEQLRELPNGHGFDALQAFYTRRGWPPEAIWFKRSQLGDLMQCLVWKDNHTEEVSLVGLHAVLIRRQVFEALRDAHPEIPPSQFEWFYYPRHQRISEDSAFSVEATQAGFRLGATSVVKTGHISKVVTGWQTYQEHLQLSGVVQRWQEYYDLIDLVAEFTGEDYDTVLAKAVRGSQNVRDGLELHDRPQLGDASGMREFYGYLDNGYLYELIAWNCSPFYQKAVAPLRNLLSRRILVVGGGLGGEVEALLGHKNFIDVFELPGALRAFLQKRFRDHEKEVAILEHDTLMERLEDLHTLHKDPYDLIVAIDTVEHIHPNEFDETMDALVEMLAPDGQFYFRNNFGQFDTYPMHFDNSAAYAAWQERHGLEICGVVEGVEGQFIRRKHETESA